MRKILLLLVGVFALVGCEKDNPITNEYPTSLANTVWEGNFIPSNDLSVEVKPKYSFFGNDRYKTSATLKHISGAVFILRFSEEGVYTYQNGKLTLRGSFYIKNADIVLPNGSVEKVSSLPNFKDFENLFGVGGVAREDVKDISVTHQSFVYENNTYKKI